MAPVAGEPAILEGEPQMAHPFSDCALCGSQRVRPLFANARAARSPRLPDKTGNPIDAFSSGKNPGARTDLFPTTTRHHCQHGAQRHAGRSGEALQLLPHGPAMQSLLATPAEVAYLGVAPAQGSCTFLYAACIDCRFFCARRRRPEARRFPRLQPRNPRGFRKASRSRPPSARKPRRRDVVVLRLRPVAGRRAVRRGEPRGRDDARHAPGGARDLLADAQPLGHAPTSCRYRRVRRPDERESANGGNAIVAGAQGRHAFGEAREKLGRRREKLRRTLVAQRPAVPYALFRAFSAHARPSRGARADELSHAWDPRSIASRRGSSTRLIAATINHRDSDHDGTTPENSPRRRLRFLPPVQRCRCGARARSTAERSRWNFGARARRGGRISGTMTDTHTKNFLDVDRVRVSTPPEARRPQAGAVSAILCRRLRMA